MCLAQFVPLFRSIDQLVLFHSNNWSILMYSQSRCVTIHFQEILHEQQLHMLVTVSATQELTVAGIVYRFMR